MIRDHTTTLSLGHRIVLLGPMLLSTSRGVSTHRMDYVLLFAILIQIPNCQTGMQQCFCPKVGGLLYDSGYATYFSLFLSALHFCRLKRESGVWQQGGDVTGFRPQPSYLSHSVVRHSLF